MKIEVCVDTHNSVNTFTFGDERLFVSIENGILSVYADEDQNKLFGQFSRWIYWARIKDNDLKLV
jgi:hypothetical protein